jgi:hypothetical protein
MTLRELIAELSKLPESMMNHQVILQKDAEGNGYSPLSEVDPNCIYVKENTWSGEVYPNMAEADEETIEYQIGSVEEWNSIKINGSPCIVFSPVN